MGYPHQNQGDPRLARYSVGSARHPHQRHQQGFSGCFGPIPEAACNRRAFYPARAAAAARRSVGLVIPMCQPTLERIGSVRVIDERSSTKGHRRRAQLRSSSPDRSAPSGFPAPGSMVTASGLPATGSGMRECRHAERDQPERDQPECDQPECDQPECDRPRMWSDVHGGGDREVPNRAPDWRVIR